MGDHESKNFNEKPNEQPPVVLPMALPFYENVPAIKSLNFISH